MPLTEDERQQIRLEEFYRDEVRKTMVPATPTPGRGLIPFLNTSLGLWLLSAIFISGVTNLYTAEQSRNERSRIQAEADRTRLNKQHTLDSELKYRLTYAIVSIGIFQRDYSDKPLSVEMQAAIDTIARMAADAPKESKLPPLNPQYADYTLAQVLSDLRETLQDSGLRTQIDHSLKTVAFFNLQFKGGPYSSAHTPLEGTNVMQSQLKRIYLARFPESEYPKPCPPNC
jgi:hypothetical protein